VTLAWRSVLPIEGALVLGSVQVDWWFAGGWAIDLFLGRQSRPHADLDVSCFRPDVETVRASLPDWQFFAADSGRLELLAASQEVPRDVHVLWCRPRGGTAWELEILIEEREGSDWIFRRNSAVRRPAAEVSWNAPRGLRCIRPEIQLLYKAKGTRDHDHGDFHHVLPRLDVPALRWLRSSLNHTLAPDEWAQAVDARLALVDS
jgi:hypothetical protein